ncbi:MAG: DUF1549 domain-containing protein, partial [Chloroflexi bacterium]|nr:DUF1549 domain-containing protein [Chloroflexota bacterium]
MKWSRFVLPMIGVLTMPVFSGPFAAQAAPMAPHGAGNQVASAPRVDFVRDVHPILQARCASCHLGGNRQGGLQMDSRAAILAGGADGAVVVPGHSEASLLIKLVSGRDPSRVMPAGGPRLTDEQVSVLRNWIDEGVSFNGAKVTSTAFYEAPLAPRILALPPAPAGDPAMNPIDRLLLRYFHERKLQPRPVVDDRTYARGVYLDIVGLLPSVSELQAFERDRTPGKRAILAQRLLNDNQDYAVHWLSFWNDALRNDYAGTGYIDG